MGKQRIASCFAELRRQQRKGLIPFCTAGDPSPEDAVKLLHTMVDAGADMLELGVPFSDPMADGPVIQRSSERALAKGVSLLTVLQMVGQFRRDNQHTPVILMGYMNPVEAMGLGNFAEQAAEVGVDGVLLVDLPPEEAAPALSVLAESGVAMIFLVAPTTSQERLENICNLAANTSFVYYVSLKGVTGSSSFDATQVRRHVAAIRACSDVPVAVGFGIKDAATAAEAAACADAVVVGSALVERLEAASGLAAWRQCTSEFISGLRQAIDQPRPQP
ncbi:MAG: tryptophan synthase subunit alpha [Candidatus Porifericomitaceae bacterium WSBS_2022_MAG_OTU9]